MNYVRLAALAKKLIEANGRTVTFNQLAVSADPAKPWRTDAPVVAHSVTQKGAFVSLSSRHLGIELTQEQLNLRANEMLMAGASDSPDVDMLRVNQIVDGTETFAVLWVQTIKPGDIAVFFAYGIKR